MSTKSLLSCLLATLALGMFVVSVGCEKPGAGDGHAHGDHDHDHDHGHGHAHDHPAHGPNGGHIFPLDTEEFQAEWKKYSDNNVIKIITLDAAGKKNFPIAASSVTISPKVGEGDVSFELPAESSENGLASVFKLEDPDLATAIPLGVDIQIKVGDKMVKGEIKAHVPLDH